ncbi:LysE family translocator [Herbiconiux sp. L3-i23]|uniref:LysE family translocator n=1 Tax=Herbiconiux sp. L3-i23 TaxID=2905871 RepID=UPI002068C922|nr:LysE family translocator [Herbiconiux sp. L3-i23]BDI22962.1 threonine transporter RhtB [Herbiconiux sp. L3-i23]
MDIPQALLGFTVVAALLTIVPGIDTALVLRSAIGRGPVAAMVTAAGVGTGTLVWGVVAAVGASAVLAASETAYRVLTLAGAAYMIWLGVSMFAKTFRPGAAHSPDTLPTPARAGLWRAWATGAGTNLLNPKVGAFYLATIPQFIPAGTSPILMGVALAAIHFALGLVWAGIIVAASRAASRWLQNAKAVKLVDRITGGVLVAFGVRLALQPH